MFQAPSVTEGSGTNDPGLSEAGHCSSHDTRCNASIRLRVERVSRPTRVAERPMVSPSWGDVPGRILDVVLAPVSRESHVSRRRHRVALQPNVSAIRLASESVVPSIESKSESSTRQELALARGNSLINPLCSQPAGRGGRCVLSPVAVPVEARCGEEEREGDPAASSAVCGRSHDGDACFGRPSASPRSSDTEALRSSSSHLPLREARSSAKGRV